MVVRQRGFNCQVFDDRAKRTIEQVRNALGQPAAFSSEFILQVCVGEGERAFRQAADRRVQESLLQKTRREFRVDAARMNVIDSESQLVVVPIDSSGVARDELLVGEQGKAARQDLIE
jgi:hypothetical protein